MLGFCTKDMQCSLKYQKINRRHFLPLSLKFLFPYYRETRRPKPKAGRPSKCLSTEPETTQGPSRKKPVQELEVAARVDCIGHWPEHRLNKRKCRLCKTGQSRIYCMKCDICLCLNGTRNCFVEYHTEY